MGCSQMETSTLVKRPKAGENAVTAATEELPRQVYAEGSVLQGIMKRQEDRTRLFKMPGNGVGHSPRRKKVTIQREAVRSMDTEHQHSLVEHSSVNEK